MSSPLVSTVAVCRLDQAPVMHMTMHMTIQRGGNAKKTKKLECG